MTFIGLFQILLFCATVLLLTKPLGSYMCLVMSGEKTFASAILSPLEKFLYKISGINPDEEMRWSTYAYALLAFSLCGALLTYILLRLQGFLPLNPMSFSTSAAPNYAT